MILTQIGVAPLIGAWIEIDTMGMKHRVDFVAPHVGVWIEMLCLR
ncbi:hypothetical protein [Bacillus sp. 1A]